MSQMSRTTKCLIAAISILLLAPNFSLFTSDVRELESFHKRSLTEMPKPATWLQHPRDAFSQTRDWYTDRLGAKMSATETLARVRYKYLAGKAASNLFRSADYIFLADPSLISKGQHAVCPAKERWPEVETAQHVALDSNVLLSEKLGVPVDTVIVPTAPLLFAEKLPLSWPQPLRSNCLENQSLQNPIYQVADDRTDLVYPLTEMLQKKVDPAYYPIHNFHFSGASALDSAAAYLDHVSRTSSQIGRLHELKQLVQMSSDISYMARFDIMRPAYDVPFETVGLIEIPRNEVSRRMSEHVPTDAEIKLRYPNGFGRYWLNSDPMAEGRLLILANSFGAFAAPAMATGFKETVQVNISHLAPLKRASFAQSMVAKMKPDRIAAVYHDGSVPGGDFRLSFGDRDEFESAADLIETRNREVFCDGLGFSIAGEGCVNEWVWPASRLPGLLGKVRSGSRVVSKQDGRGTISFGPYLNLAKGGYKFTIKLNQRGDTDVQTLVRWDVAGRFEESGPLSLIRSGDIPHGLETFSMEIDLESDLYETQIRTYAVAAAAVEIHSLKIEALEDQR